MGGGFKPTSADSEAFALSHDMPPLLKNTKFCCAFILFKLWPHYHRLNMKINLPDPIPLQMLFSYGEKPVFQS